MNSPEDIDWGPIRLAFTDMDGTLYKGTTDFPYTPRFVAELRKRVSNVCFLSNNSSKSHSTYYQRLRRMGVELRIEDILLSTDGTIAFLRKSAISRVHLVGTRALEQCFGNAGIEISTDMPDAVVIGFDTELTYSKIERACLLLQDPEMPYYATHIDKVCPTERGDIPDVGSFIALIHAAVGRMPQGTFGKPHKEMVSHVYEKHGVAPANSIFFGDRVYTDHAMAQACGAMFVGVLTGEATREQLEALPNTFVFESVGNVFA